MTTQTIDPSTDLPAARRDRGMLVLQYGVALLAFAGALLLAVLR